MELLEAFGGGIEAVAVVRFDAAFAGLSPENFVADVLEERLGARHVLVGADFCYGTRRSGTVTTLLRDGARNGFAVTVVPPILISGERVSSTQIRGLVASGDLPAARHLLGHPFVVRGVVGHGKKLGRTSGLPDGQPPPVPARPAPAGQRRLRGLRPSRGWAGGPGRRQRRHQPDHGHRRGPQGGGVPDGRLRRGPIRPALRLGLPREGPRRAQVRRPGRAGHADGRGRRAGRLPPA